MVSVFLWTKTAGDKAVAKERHSSSTEMNKISADFSLPRTSIIQQSSYAKLDFYLATFSERTVSI